MFNKIKNNKGLALALLVLIVIIVMNIGSEKSSNESELDESLASFYKKEEVSSKKLFVVRYISSVLRISNLCS